MHVRRVTSAVRRQRIRLEYWPDEDLWTDTDSPGWFPALRTLPLVMALLSYKEISKQKDPTLVYLELLSRHYGEGVIEMVSEAEHAFASGYIGERAVRTWRERMKILEECGFIKTTQVGLQNYKYVALIHPTTAVKRLYDKRQVPENWWKAYVARKFETKEATYEQRELERIDDDDDGPKRKRTSVKKVKQQLVT